MVDAEDLAFQRMEIIQTENPGAMTKHDVEENDDTEWAVVTIADENGGSLSVEIIESDTSWKRSDLIEHYNELAEDMEIAVILPDEAFEEVAARLARDGSPNIDLLTYSDLGLIPRG